MAAAGKPMIVLRSGAVARVAIGSVLAVATRPVLRAILRNEEPDGSVLLFALAAARQLGVAGAVVAALAPIPLIGADVWVLRRLAESRRRLAPTRATRLGTWTSV